MFNRINESFDKKYQPLTETTQSDAEMLKRLLTATANSMLKAGNNNLKAFEVAFQDDIENFFPGYCWWEVTDCQIFNELFTTRDPFATIDCIINNLKDEFKANGTTASQAEEDIIEENLEEDDYFDFQSDIYNAISDVMFKYHNNSKEVSQRDVEYAIEWFLNHFYEDDNLPINECLTKMASNKSESELKALKEKIVSKISKHYLKEDNHKTLNEDPAFVLSDDELNDPKELDFKKIMKRNAEAEAKAQAEKERQERIAAAKEKYKDVLAGIDLSNVEDAISKLFDALVPSQGMAETVAGELVRAMMRILYRDYNDGDKFFMGYGIETCAGSAQYLYDMGFSSTISSILDDNYRYADDDGAYTAAIEELAGEVVKHILDNADLLAEPNDTDSRDYPSDFIEEHQPTFDYDFTLPYDVQKYIDAGHIDTREIEGIVESNLDSNGIKYGSIDAYSDTVYINDLPRDDYEEVERFEMWQDSYWEYEISEWESEYGDPDEDDEEDDDIDESKKINEVPVYDMSPNYDARKSFYGKARVDDQGNEKTLYSYNTPVAKIVDGKVELLPKWDWSQTTLRHVKEFLLQNGFEATSLKQMRSTYL